MIAAFSVRASYIVSGIFLCLTTPERCGVTATVDTLEEGLVPMHQLPPAIEAGTTIGPRSGDKRHLGAAEGDLLLLQTCYQDDDCAPGLFTMSGMRTRCRTTPTSPGQTICCKPFATPCDWDEACCSGYCDLRRERCVDAATRASQPSVFPPTPTPIAGPIARTRGPYSPTDIMGGLTSHPSPSPTESTAEGGGSSPEATPQSLSPFSLDTSGYGHGFGSGGSYENTPQCEPSYLSGTIETLAMSEARVQAVAVDSQGNVFYALGFGKGMGGTIRRAAATSCTSSSADNEQANSLYDDDELASGMTGNETTPGNVGGVNNTYGCSGDELVHKGTGVILAIAVNADDDIVFTMDDALAESGGLYVLRMAPGGVPRGGLHSLDAGKTSSTTDQTDEPSDGGISESNSASGSTGCDEAIPLATGLGPFLPGVAVCPATGDVYVARGHTGLTRVVRGVNGGFETKMEWTMADMTFAEGDQEHAPLMIWDLAVDSVGIVYLTTYVQGIVIKGIFPVHGGDPKMRLVAGIWDSGVSASTGDGGRATGAAMAFPKGIAIDGDDTVFIAEFQGGRIRQATAGGVISACAGTGKQGYTGDGGPASEASMSMPNAIAFVPGEVGGKLVIADFGNSAVRVITPLCSQGNGEQ